MSILEKRHIPGTAGGALLGGALLGGTGYLLAGPPGLVVGVVSGTAAGALAGHRVAESRDPRDSVGHFQDIYVSMSYRVDGMDWGDYEPAYRFGVETYATRGGQAFAEAEPALGARWLRERGRSRLSWEQARGPVAHVWRDMDETLLGRRDRSARRRPA